MVFFVHNDVTLLLQKMTVACAADCITRKLHKISFTHLDPLGGGEPISYYYVMMIRPGMIEGLQSLSNHYTLVLLTHVNNSNCSYSILIFSVNSFFLFFFRDGMSTSKLHFRSLMQTVACFRAVC